AVPFGPVDRVVNWLAARLREAPCGLGHRQNLDLRLALHPFLGGEHHETTVGPRPATWTSSHQTFSPSLGHDLPRLLLGCLETPTDICTPCPLLAARRIIGGVAVGEGSDRIKA